MKVNVTWDTPQGKVRKYVLGKATDFNTKNVEIPDELAKLLLNIQTLQGLAEAALEGLYNYNTIPATAKETLSCLYLTHVTDAERADLALAERRLKNKASVARTRGSLLPSSTDSE